MKKALPFLAAALVLGACSTSNQIAQQRDYNDDVYYSEARATEIIPLTKAQRQAAISREDRQRKEEQLQGSIYNDYSYRGGIYYYGNPWRSIYDYNRFYDPFYSYYNGFYSPGISPYLGMYSPWLFSNPYRSFYAYPYTGSYYWGPVSYNSYYPGYSYGAYPGGYYPSIVNNDPNYRARPARGAENIGGFVNPVGTIRRDGQGVIMSSPNRGETYERNPSATSSRRASSATTERARPARTQPSERQYPDYSQDNTPSRAPQIQTTMSPPPSSGNYGGGGSSGGSSDDGSRARPARAGN